MVPLDGLGNPAFMRVIGRYGEFMGNMGRFWYSNKPSCTTAIAPTRLAPTALLVGLAADDGLNDGDYWKADKPLMVSISLWKSAAVA